MVATAQSSADRAAADHRRHARLLEDRGRQARDRRRRRSPCASVVDAAVATFIHTASAKGLRLVASCDDAPGRRPRRRPAPHPPDPQQPPVQRGEVHRGRRDRGDGPGARRAGDGAQTDRARRRRHRRRPHRRAAARLFARVRPGRAVDHAALRRHRPRPRDLPAARRAHGRRRDDGQRGRAGHDDAAGRHPAGRRSRRTSCPRPSFTATTVLASAPTPSRDEAIARAEPRAAGRGPLGQPGGAAAPARRHRVLRRRRARRRRRRSSCSRPGDYAMVLTDVHMPRLDGYELAEAIRRHEAEHGLAADADHGADAPT